MAAPDATVARRFADMVRRKGRQVILRRLGNVNGGPISPPIVANMVTDGAALAGATTISIRADMADGRLVAGDRLVIGTMAPIAVANPVTARGFSVNPATPATPGFSNVTLASPLPGNVADGTAITPLWAADQPVWIMEQAFSLALLGNQIQAGDLRITMAASNVAQPHVIDQLLIDGFVRSIVNVDRQMAPGGVVVAWNIQAR